MPRKQITIGIADDMLLDQTLIEHQIKKLKNISILFRSGNGNELLFKLHHYKPDILILDLYMPIMNGWEVLPLLKSVYQGQIICTSSIAEPNLNDRLRVLGVGGFATKQGNQLSKAIEQAIKGSSYFESSSETLLPNTRKPQHEALVDGRELTIINKLAEGKDSKKISYELGGLTEQTIDTYIKHLLARTECKNRTQLVAWAFSFGLIYTFDEQYQLPKPKVTIHKYQVA